jgi:RHS repeat-associated protein
MSEGSNPIDLLAGPKSGGALRGMGETFAPDLFTGTGNLSIPIELPPGRNNFQPSLTLSCSTGHGNGPFGFGWTTSIPTIARKTSKGIPTYDDTKDIFVLTGAEDLVPVPGAPAGGQRYRPRTETLFSRIDHYRHIGPGGTLVDYWEVRTREGFTSYFGLAPKLADHVGASAARQTDPAQAEHVFSWMLTATVDSFGNRIEYDYSADSGNHYGRTWSTPYLAAIRYGDWKSGSQQRFAVHVEVDYAARPDPFSSYRAGFEIRTTRRCTAIRSVTDIDRIRKLRTYHLTYSDDPSAPPAPAPFNAVSLLRQVRIEGHDDTRPAGQQSEWLPAMVFGYSPFAPEKRQFRALTGSELPPRSLARAEMQLVDLFGKGLPDFVEMTGRDARYWKNLGDGTFDRPRSMKDCPAGFTFADRNVQLLDANGDGRLDLVVTGDRIAGYFPLAFDGLWDRRSFQKWEKAPSFNLKDPAVRLLDLDGDGVTDALRSGTRFECYFNDARRGWHTTREVEPGPLEDFPNVDFSDSRVRLADMSGDGLLDIVYIHDGLIEYWPNLGYGRFGKRIRMHQSPRLRWGYDPRRVLLGDVDGDGCADLVFVDDHEVTLWINQSGNGFSDPIVIKGTPPIYGGDDVRLVDLFGQGIVGLLWSSDLNAIGRPHHFFLDFCGGTKPYLVDDVDNQRGARIAISYASSTRFYLEDEKRRETRWHTTLPFPVQVVAEVAVTDLISVGKMVSQYRYHHGYWDGADREFRGFGHVDQRDTQTFDQWSGAPLPPEQFSPPTERRSWFHLGPLGDEYGTWSEPDFSSEFWSGDPQRLTRSTDAAGLLAALPRRVARDAVRTLRGQPIRTELYALDGDARQDRPYTVTEQLGAVCEVVDDGGKPRLIDRAADLPTNQANGIRLFFPRAVAERSTQWERGSDPQTRLQFTEYRVQPADPFDRYGRPRVVVSVAVPRGRDYTQPTAGAHSPFLATAAVSDYAARDDSVHILDRVWRTTQFEVIDDPSAAGLDVFAFKQVVDAGTAKLVPIAQEIQYFDGPAFSGAPLGQIEGHGAVTRVEQLIVTNQILAQAFSGATPFYFTGAPPAPEYPAGFVAAAPKHAGYVERRAPTFPQHVAGYFAVTKQQRYDFQTAGGGSRGLVLEQRDPLGHALVSQFDAQELRPVLVTDALGFTSRAEYDPRTFLPIRIHDRNDAVTEYGYTPLGAVASIARLGRPGDKGDTTAIPGTELVYDYLAFVQRGQPISVHATQRIYHVLDPPSDAARADDVLAKREYSDGFGRLLQTRTLAEDVLYADGAGLPIDQAANGPAVGTARGAGDPANVAVSGWQVYDNKGRIVEQYEPYFARGWDYQPPDAQSLGERTRLYYDARGLTTRIVHPDGSERRIVLGVPTTLSTPESFAPTPWESYVYDENDNAARSTITDENGAAVPSASLNVPATHLDTPQSFEVDALGRTVRHVARNGRDPVDGSGNPQWFVTQSVYDIRGNLTQVLDAENRVAFSNVFDLAATARAWRRESIDGGARIVVLDAAGDPVEQRDGKQALTLRTFDPLRRPDRTWARDAQGEPVALRERSFYDGAKAVHMVGRLHRRDDGAGRIEVAAYDFKGNPLDKTRAVISDAAIAKQPFIPDWNHLVDGDLGDRYHLTMTYDAPGRVVAVTCPAIAVGGAARTMQRNYDRGGLLASVAIDHQPVVAVIAHNARGQRILLVHGNGLMTRLAYDRKTWRLRRLRSEGFKSTQPNRYAPDGQAAHVHQDVAYESDLVGNVVRTEEHTPGCGVPNSADGVDKLVRLFEQDPLYRLTSSTGRETDVPPTEPWDASPRSTDITQARSYGETYSYDAVGNRRSLTHTSAQSFTRAYSLSPGSNRLASMTSGAHTFAYAYDGSGNVTTENTDRHFEWDHSDRLRRFVRRTGNSEPSTYTQYLYDAAGRRVKKWTRVQGGKIESTSYVDDIFEHVRQSGTGGDHQNGAVYAVDGDRRYAQLRIGPALAGDAIPAGIKSIFFLADHLGTYGTVLDAVGGTFVQREEFTAFGETSFGSYGRKRYRFTGRERDAESGLYYQGARYYAPWLGRWQSPDPELGRATLNLYEYVDNRPLQLVDPSGTTPILPAKPELAADPKSVKMQRLADKKNPTIETALTVKKEDQHPVTLSIHWLSQFAPGLTEDQAQKNCYPTARQMVLDANRAARPDLKWPKQLDPKDNKIQVAFHDDSLGHVVAIEGEAQRARQYIDRLLDAGAVVLAGVSYEPGHGKKTVTGDKRDVATDHFIAIYGRGYDEDGHVFYRFKDPGFRGVGSSDNPLRFLQIDAKTVVPFMPSDQKLYVDSNTGNLFRPVLDYDQVMDNRTGRDFNPVNSPYEVTQVRGFKMRGMPAP